MMMRPDQTGNSMGSQVKRGETKQFASVAGGMTEKLVDVLFFSSILLSIPAIGGMVVACMKWNEPCDQEFAKWYLLVTGILQIFNLCAGAWGVHKAHLQLDEDLIVYQVHKERDGAYDPAMEARLKEAADDGSFNPQKLQQSCGCAPFIFMIFGWVYYGKIVVCDSYVQGWMWTVLLTQALAPFVICCCGVPLALACGMCKIAHYANDDSSEISDSDVDDENNNIA